LTHYFEKASYIPVGMLSLFATAQPWVELILGLLLMIGLASRFSLIAGGLVILSLVIGTNLAQDWLVSGLQLIYAFLYYYLLAHLDQNRYSIDGMRKG
jgi:thiosulfate dehydrogenase [quinone] large subunit